MDESPSDWDYNTARMRPNEEFDEVCGILQRRIAELEDALRGARSAAWHHRVKTRPLARLLWIEAEAERLLQDGIGIDPVLQEYYDEHCAALKED